MLVDDRVEHLVGDVAGERDQFDSFFGGQETVYRHGWVA